MKIIKNSLSLVALSSLLVSGAGVLSGCGGGASAAPVPPTNPNSNANRIAFSSNRDGNFEIYTVNPDGSDAQRVTTATGDDTKPAWSRDHSKIAFASERDGNSEIYVVGIRDGKPSGEAQRITTDPAIDTAPSWNPDGTKLVFQSNRGAFVSSLYIVDVGNRNTQRLTQRPQFNDGNPSWSPRGDLIAFDSQQAPISGQNYPEGITSYLFTIKPNSADLTQITMGGRNMDQDPAWNVNGTRLVYSDPLSISIVDLNDGLKTSLTQINKGDFVSPVYSLDGKQVAFSGFTKEFSKISVYLLEADGASKTPLRLLQDTSESKDPAW